MPWVGFEPTIPVFEPAKAVHALDRAATLFVRHWEMSAIIIRLLKQILFEMMTVKFWFLWWEHNS
jgi:hypothetical protein